MSCNIQYKNGKINVLDDSGNPSKLYKDAVDKFGEEKGLEMYLVSKSNSFLDFFAPKINKSNNYEKSNTEYRDRRRWNPSRGNQTLEGAPIIKTRKNVTGADPELTYWAEEYARRNNIPYKRQSKYVEVDEQRAKRIAEAYDKMEHNPQDPKVKEAFQNLINQTISQYKILEEAGYKFYFFDETNDPYNGSPYGAMEELRNQKRMGSFATEAGFGSGATQLNVEDNPMLADTGLTWGWGSVNGKKKRVLANDLFRAVHDAFGHGLEGAGFRARGEENAWQAHARLFTGSAVGAITSETRGQNSWLNYGKFGEQNQTAKVEDTIFADQKTGLMPEWTWKEGFDEGVEEVQLEPTLQEVTNYVASNNRTEAELNQNQKADLINVLISNPDFKAEDFYDEFGMFVIPKKHYSRYELLTLNEEQIKEAVDALLNTDFTPNVEVAGTIEQINEKNAFGKLVNLNPNISEKEKLREQVLNGEREDYKTAEVLIETLDGELISTKNNNTEQILPLVVKETFKTDLVSSLETFSLSTLQQGEEQTRIVLKAIENDLISQGIDAIGLSQKPIDEELVDFLNTAKTFINSPTKENTKTFAEKLDVYFERDLEPKVDVVKSNKVDRNYVKLNTNLTEEQLYEKKGLIQSELGKGIYIQTANESLEDLYNNLRTYTEKYTGTLEQYVQEQIAEMDYNNAENAEAIVLYKMYFGVVNEVTNDAVSEATNSVLVTIKDYLLRKYNTEEKKELLTEGIDFLKKVQYSPGYFAKTIARSLSRLVYIPVAKTVNFDNTSINFDYFPIPNINTAISERYRDFDDEKKYPIKFLYDKSIVDSDGNIIDKKYKKLDDNSLWVNSTEFDDNYIYRGMSEAELLEAISVGRIKSNASMNLGGQEDTTSFAQYPAQARNYAHGFTASHDTVTFNNPKYVIKVNKKNVKYRPTLEDNPKGEIDVFGSIPTSEITGIFEIRLASTTFANTDIREDKYREGLISQGSANGASQEAVGRDVNMSEVGINTQENMLQKEIQEFLFKGTEKSQRPQYNNATKQLTGNYNYLTEDYVSDFYIEQLKEKQKNSPKYRNFYSNFEVNEKGINLLNTDDITMQQIEIYADDNLRQYSLLSKQMPNLRVDDINENQRDLIVNNPQTLEDYKKDLFRVNDNTIILKDNTEDFIKVNGEIYENVETDSNLSVFAKIETEKSDYYQYNIKQPKTNIKLSDYNYLATQEELFTSPKKYLKKEEKERIIEEEFACNTANIKKPNIWKIL